MKITNLKNGRLLITLNINGVKVNFETDSTEAAFQAVKKIFNQ